MGYTLSEEALDQLGNTILDALQADRHVPHGSLQAFLKGVPVSPHKSYVAAKNLQGAWNQKEELSLDEAGQGYDS